MFKLVFKRLLMSISLLFAVTFLTFFVNSFAPTDIARTLLGANGTAAQYLELREQLGLNRPLLSARCAAPPARIDPVTQSLQS